MHNRIMLKIDVLSISFDEDIKYSSSSCNTTTQDKETLGGKMLSDRCFVFII